MNAIRLIPRPKDQAYRFSWLVLRCDVCFTRRLAIAGREFPPCRNWNCPEGRGN